MPSVIENKEKRHQLLSNASALLQAGLNTTELKEEYRKLITEADEIEANIVLQEKLERYLTPEERSTPAPVAAPAVITREETRTQKMNRLNASFRHFLRNGLRPDSVEQRDLVTSSTGEVLVPEEFDSDWVSALKNYGPIGALAKRKTGTRPTKSMVSDDSASSMTYVPETGQTSTIEEDPTLLSEVTGTDSLVTLIKVSNQEVADVENIQQFINEISGLRVARSLEYALLTGKDNGSNTQLPNSYTGGLLGFVSAGVTQTAGQLAAGPTHAQLSALAASVDHAYRVAPNSGFMVSQSVHDFLAASVDTTGRPLYKFDSNTGLLMVAGKPVYVASNSAMPAYNAASSPIALFGNFSRAYTYLTDGMRIRVLRERFSDTLCTGVMAYFRVGAAPLLSSAVKALVSAAS